MSKHVGENCGKLCIFSDLSAKRGITPQKFDANLRHLNLICSTVRQSHICKISAQYIKALLLEKSAETVYFQYSKFKKGHTCNSHKI